MEEKAALKRVLERERKARKESEKILEEKSLELFKANQELKKLYNSLENRYQKIVEQANDIIFRGDENGYCIFVNPVASRILGYSREELLGKHFTELVTTDMTQEVIQFYLNQRKTLKESSYLEFTVNTKDGNIKWIGQNVRLIIEEGEIIGTSAVARDITLQKQAEEQVRRNEKKYKAIIENMELGLLEVDINGIAVSANSRFSKMTGYSENEIIGKNPAILLMDKASKELISDKQIERERGESSVYEVKGKKKNGEIIWLLISGAPRFDKEGNYIGSTGIHMDITKQKRLMNQLEAAKSLAEESSRAKETFLAHMSHENRTPLNSVLGMTHLLQDTNPTAKQREYLETIQYSSEILLNIISDILDISKIEAGEAEFNESPFNLIELLKAQHKTFAFRMQEKAVKVNLEIQGDQNTLLIGDKLFINQILMNLLGNATKFTEEGEINISLNLENKVSNSVLAEFKISDTGIGIEPGQLNNIFDSFKQAEQNTALKYGGTGLGLSIAKHLVELHGGNIQVESKLNEGTTFYLTIPFRISDIPIKNSNDTKPIADSKSLKGTKVLVAEDNEMNQKFLSKVLEKQEVEFVICDNGMLALEKAKTEPFDLILMDIQMPKLNGYQTTQEIRKLKNSNQSIPIIALTASALVDERKKVLASGMNEHLSKPFSPSQLKSVMEKLLHQNSNGFQIQLNRKYLTEFYSEDIEFKREMLSLFLKNVEGEMDNLKLAIANYDNESVYQIAHKNKTSFNMVGLNELESILKDIEQLAKNKDVNYQEVSIPLFNKLDFAIEAVKLELNNI